MKRERLKIKGKTAFGIIDVEVLSKPKEICGEVWVLVNWPYKHMNAEEPLMLRKIIHQASGTPLAISAKHRQTNKSMFEDVETFLNKIPEDQRSKIFKEVKILNQTKQP
jgi:hypothetical protein